MSGKTSLIAACVHALIFVFVLSLLDVEEGFQGIFSFPSILGGSIKRIPCSVTKVNLDATRAEREGAAAASRAQSKASRDAQKTLGALSSEERKKIRLFHNAEFKKTNDKLLTAQKSVTKAEKEHRVCIPETRPTARSTGSMMAN